MDHDEEKNEWEWMKALHKCQVIERNLSLCYLSSDILKSRSNEVYVRLPNFV